MNNDDTRSRILAAAGALFAAKGRDGVGIRGIAEKVGVSVNTVMYHFKTKDNLYCTVVMDRITSEIPFGSFFAAAQGGAPLTPQAASDATAGFVRGLFDFFMQPEKRELVDFMVQAIFSRDSEVAATLTEAFRAYDKYLAEFYRTAGVQCDDLDVRFLSYTIWPHLMFLVSAREAIGANMGEENVNREFYYQMARRMARVFCNHLDLPPHDESIWQIDGGAESPGNHPSA